MLKNKKRRWYFLDPLNTFIVFNSSIPALVHCTDLNSLRAAGVGAPYVPVGIYGHCKFRALPSWAAADTSVSEGLKTRIFPLNRAHLLSFNPLVLELDIYSLAHHFAKCEYFMNQEE